MLGKPAEGEAQVMLEYGYEASRDLALEEVPVPPVVVRTVEADDLHGVFVVEPLERGYGATLGNPLRRVLLSSVPGTAVTWVRIDGVQHEYSTLPHVKEDVLDILLNIKAIHLRASSSRPGKLRLEVKGEGEVCAGDIMTSSDFEIVNPELHIATLDHPDASLVVELNVEQGRGYVAATSVSGLPIGVLPVDAVFTPVRRVNQSVEQTRVGQRTDFDRLVLEIWTNGTIGPGDALRYAAGQLVDHFFRLQNFNETAGHDGDKPAWIPPSVYNLPVESLGLTARTLNCLKRSAIHKVGEVLERSRADLLRIRNFGEKALLELDDRLAALGIQHSGIRAKGDPTVGPTELDRVDGDTLAQALAAADSNGSADSQEDD